MNRDEVINLLSILKATYPQSFRNMTAEEGRGTISAWLMDFEDINYEYILAAVKRYKSDITKVFAPTVNDIHKVLNDMVYEAETLISTDRHARRLLEIPECCRNCKIESRSYLDKCWQIDCPKDKDNIERSKKLQLQLLTDEKKEALQKMSDNINGKNKNIDVLSLLGLTDDIKLIGE